MVPWCSPLPSWPRSLPAYSSGVCALRSGVAATGVGCALMPRSAAMAELGDVVVALTVVDVGDTAGLVDEVLGRPVLVAVRVPRVHLEVDGHRPGDPEALDRRGDVGALLLEVELRGVDADDDQAAAAVRLLEVLQVGDGAHAVDAGERPEVDEHNLAAQAVHGEGLAVQPAVEAGELGRSHALVGGDERRVAAAGGGAGRGWSEQPGDQDGGHNQSGQPGQCPSIARHVRFTVRGGALAVALSRGAGSRGAS